MRRSSRTASPAHAGFAYLWVLLLIAFIGLGLSLALDVQATAARRERERELLAIGRQFRLAIARYVELQRSPAPGGQAAQPVQPVQPVPVAPGAGPAVAPDRYPASLDDLLKDPRSPGVTRHLRQVFVDPMTGKAEWGLLRVGGRIVGVFSLSEQLPIKQDGFEAEDAGFRGKQKYSEWVFTHPANALAQPATAPGTGKMP